MRIVIVEDERPAQERLIAAIRSVAPDTQIVATLTGVTETVEWLDGNPAPDLLVLDIQLSDGLSFEILQRKEVSCPVIFATAHDEYLMQAFGANGIDYLLKPIREDRLAEALNKYRRLEKHFSPARLLDFMHSDKVRRERMLVRKGINFIPIKIADIAYVYTADKLVFLVTSAGARYMLDRPIGDLEAELDNSRFFRANRAYLVSIDSVVRCRSYGKGRLLIELLPKSNDEVVVSQERSAALRDWLGR
jgi:two-component system LytT family response regulator